MSKNKRSGRTSTEAKKRYHDKVYTDLNVALPHALYRQYREYCRLHGLSMRSQLMALIADLLGLTSVEDMLARQAVMDAALYRAANEAYDRMTADSSPQPKVKNARFIT